MAFFASAAALLSSSSSPPPAPAAPAAATSAAIVNIFGTRLMATVFHQNPDRVVGFVATSRSARHACVTAFENRKRLLVTGFHVPPARKSGLPTLVRMKSRCSGVRSATDPLPLYSYIAAAFG